MLPSCVTDTGWNTSLFVVKSQAVNGNVGIVSFENFDLRGVHWKQEFTAVDSVPMAYVRRQSIGITMNGI